jgi:hypothetical protein
MNALVDICTNGLPDIINGTIGINDAESFRLRCGKAEEGLTGTHLKIIARRFHPIGIMLKSLMG